MTIDKIRKFFGLHVHERRLFLIGDCCFVKCTTCGAESIHWMPSLNAINYAKEFHKKDLSDYIDLKKALEQNE